RCLFDFPLHGDGLPQIHMFNYIITYKRDYNEGPTTVSAVGTFYGAPGFPASMPLAWNDAMWAKYKLGELLKLTDPATRAPTVRNTFYRPRAGDPVLFGGALAPSVFPSFRPSPLTLLPSLHLSPLALVRLALRPPIPHSRREAVLLGEALPGGPAGFVFPVERRGQRGGGAPAGQRDHGDPVLVGAEADPELVAGSDRLRALRLLAVERDLAAVDRLRGQRAVLEKP